MKFTLNSKVILSGIGYAAEQHIKNSLTMDNPKFRDLERMGRYKGNTPQRISFYESTDQGLVIPRGFATRAYQICQEHGEQITVIDDRRTLPPVSFQFNGYLKPFQADAVKDMLRHDSGVLSSGTGSGKTVMGLYLIFEREQPTLIIVHTKELLNQWIERIESFLGIPATEVGMIGAGKFTLGDKITVGMVQTLCKRVDDVTNKFGHIIVDECHRCPSKTFLDVVTAFDARYLLGLSATPYRRDGLTRAIYFHLGDCRHQVDKAALLDRGHLCQAQVIWHETAFDTVLDASTEYSKVLSELTQDRERNRQICNDVAGDDCQGIKLVLSDRRDHCQELQRILKEGHGLDSTVLTGGMSAKERAAAAEEINNSTVKILICTGQLVGEGYDLPALETLFLTTPIKFSGRLIQYVGRVLRPSPGKDRAIIHDYSDNLVGVLDHSARARASVYQNEGIKAA